MLAVSKFHGFVPRQPPPPEHAGMDLASCRRRQRHSPCPCCDAALQCLLDTGMLLSHASAHIMGGLVQLGSTGALRAAAAAAVATAAACPAAACAGFATLNAIVLDC